MVKDFRVAVVQAKVPQTREEGEAQVKRYIDEAVKKSVDMIGLPEDCLASLKYAIEGYDPFKFLSQLAKDNKVYLFGANTFVEKDGGRRNIGFVFDREGKLLVRHNKIVLTPPEEKDGLIPGDTLKVFDTEFGKMSLLVCKDAFHRYAAWFFDQIRRAGADVVLVPSYSLNVSKRSVGLWVDSLKTLSKWFDVYILAPGTIGLNNTDFASFGHALIICPNREVLAEGSFDKEEILYAKLDVKNLEEIRNTYGSKWQPKEVPQVKLRVS